MKVSISYHGFQGNGILAIGQVVETSEDEEEEEEEAIKTNLDVWGGFYVTYGPPSISSIYNWATSKMVFFSIHMEQTNKKKGKWRLFS